MLDLLFSQSLVVVVVYDQPAWWLWIMPTCIVYFNSDLGENYLQSHYLDVFVGLGEHQ